MSASKCPVTNIKISRLVVSDSDRWLVLGFITVFALNWFSPSTATAAPSQEPLPMSSFIAAKNSGSSSASEYSIFGQDMQEAYGKHFFTHFRFRPIGISITNDGFTEILMRMPRSSRFRSFLSIDVALDNTGKIMRAKMNVQRRFIEDKVQGAFARDFSKSFIQAAVPTEELDKVRSITNEIFFRQDITRVTDVKVTSDKGKEETSSTIFKLGPGKLREGDIIIMGEGADLPDLPKRPSELYKCFIGKVKTSEVNLTETILKFSNEKVEGEDCLVISVESLEDRDVKKPDLDFGNLPLHIPSL